MLSVIKKIAKYALKKEYREQLDNFSLSAKLEKIKSSNNDSSDKYLFITRVNEMVGTYSDYAVFLCYIEMALRKGMIPVIDRESIKNYYLNGDNGINTWEYFFEQPCGISLSEVLEKDANIYRCYTLDLNSAMLIGCRDSFITEYWRIIARKYIRLNDKTSKHVEKWQKLLIEGKRVLGVALREGYELWFNKTNIGKDHSFQATADEMLNIVIERIDSWECDFVFLACQTDKSIDIFRRALGEKLIYYPRKRTIIEGEKAHSLRSIEEEKANELDYITEMNILSRCSCFICSENSGTEAVYLMSDGFEHFYCVDKGRKGN